MDSTLFLAVAMLASLVFHGWANLVEAKKAREHARMTLEVHGMLVQLTEKDAKLRRQIFDKVMEQEPRP